MFAAPFDDDNETTNNSENNIINKKRSAHTRTQKIYPKENFDTNKVNNVLSKIHNSLDSDDDEDKMLFNPPPKSVSAGVQKTIPLEQKEQMTNMTSNSNPMFRTFGRAPQPNYEGTDNLDLNDYSNYGDKKSNDECSGLSNSICINSCSTPSATGVIVNDVGESRLGNFSIYSPLGN